MTQQTPLYMHRPFLAGLILIAVAFKEWSAVGFGALDYSHTMRLVIPGVTLAAIGFQTNSGFDVTATGSSANRSGSR